MFSKVDVNRTATLGGVWAELEAVKATAKASRNAMMETTFMTFSLCEQEI